MFLNHSNDNLLTLLDQFYYNLLAFNKAILKL